MFPQLHRYYDLVCHRCFAPSFAHLFPLVDFTEQHRLLLFLTKAYYTFLPALPRVLCNQKIGHPLHFYLVVVANVNNYFQHCLCHYEASITGLSSSAPYKISTGIIVPVFPYRSPQENFHSPAA